jgi:2-hydroxycyclohexanecarboxyl-CoA dehydrogenase
MTIHAIGSNQQPTPPAPSGDRRVALVSGGAGGIGQEVAAELLRAGAAVAIGDIDAQRAATVATQLTQIGGDVIWVDLNVTEQSSVIRAIGEVQQRLGPIDILTNCAGWNVAIKLLNSDEAYWKQTIETNLLGCVRMTHAVLGGMIERGYGRIVHVTGEAGRIGTAEQSLISAANGGVTAFAKAIARETLSNGVTVNCVSPGPTATPMLDQLISYSDDAAGMIAGLRASVPMGRLGTPSDIAPVVAFLASEGAGFITGQTLSVSGGMTMA